ncbi:hypothetical protein [Aneurinibacillus danicus]|jgi:hypothetical protein|uniref:Uncharacterized protein n=1 Tax=Aneurinibacillus danicus TaxID=267746 RepID=A0A511V7T5_9BACL|nr:hypothetical protein [Aneurinibacillus danicus]GEN33753.1 hypothetical protein ADA01nite_12130 [Aneurinibacillus danicus]
MAVHLRIDSRVHLFRFLQVGKLYKQGYYKRYINLLKNFGIETVVSPLSMGYTSISRAKSQSDARTDMIGIRQ